jgi:hypothetical protein
MARNRGSQDLLPEPAGLDGVSPPQAIAAAPPPKKSLMGTLAGLGLVSVLAGAAGGL